MYGDHENSASIALDIEKQSSETDSSELLAGQPKLTVQEFKLTVVDLFAASFSMQFFYYAYWMHDVGVGSVLSMMLTALIFNYWSYKALIYFAENFQFKSFIQLGDLLAHSASRFIFQFAFLCLNGYALLSFMTEMNSYCCLLTLHLGIHNRFLVTPSSIVWLLFIVVALSPFLILKEVKKSMLLNLLILVSTFFFIGVTTFAHTSSKSKLSEMETNVTRHMLWQEGSLSAIFVEVISSFSAHANLMDIYTETAKRSSRKFKKAINIQMALLALIYVWIGLAGRFLFSPGEGSLGSFAPASIIANVNIKIVWGIFMVLLSINNFLYQFNPFLDSVVKLVNDFSRPREENQNAQKEGQAYSLISFWVLLFTALAASSGEYFGVDFDGYGRLLTTLMLPLLFIVTPLELYRRCVKGWVSSLTVGAAIAFSIWVFFDTAKFIIVSKKLV